MSEQYGVSSDTAELDDIVQGPAIIEYVPVDSGATCAKGQVFMWDATNNNFVDCTDEDAQAFAVCLETKTLSGDTQVRCLRKGKVLKSALDATNAADVDVLQKLVSVGILPFTSGQL